LTLLHQGKPLNVVSNQLTAASANSGGGRVAVLRNNLGAEPRMPVLPLGQDVGRMKFTPDQTRALELLADSPRGCTEAILLAHGFSIELLAELVRDGLATAEPERMRASGQPVEVVRLHITEAGWRALAAR
jgi:hypothetical protein